MHWGPNLDLFKIDAYIWDLDNVPVPPSEVADSRKGAFKVGQFVVFKNKDGWLDAALMWLIGEVIHLAGVDQKILQIHLWGTTSHHEVKAFVRELSEWVWRPTWIRTGSRCFAYRHPTPVKEWVREVRHVSA